MSQLLNVSLNVEYISCIMYHKVTPIIYVIKYGLVSLKGQIDLLFPWITLIFITTITLLSFKDSLNCSNDLFYLSNLFFYLLFSFRILIALPLNHSRSIYASIN